MKKSQFVIYLLKNIFAKKITNYEFSNCWNGSVR